MDSNHISKCLYVNLGPGFLHSERVQCLRLVLVIIKSDVTTQSSPDQLGADHALYARQPELTLQLVLV